MDSVNVKHFHHGRKFCQCWEQTRRQVIIINTREDLHDGAQGPLSTGRGNRKA